MTGSSQAIAARTYTLYRIRGGGSANHPSADACDDINCCKAYKTAEQAAEGWGSMAARYEEKLARAVSETDGEIILYDGAPILAVFFSSADGSTQGAGCLAIDIDLADDEEEVVTHTVQQDADPQHPHPFIRFAEAEHHISKHPGQHADREHVLHTEMAEEPGD